MATVPLCSEIEGGPWLFFSAIAGKALEEQLGALCFVVSTPRGLLII